MSARDEPAAARRSSTRAHSDLPAPRLRPWQPWAALAGFAFLLHFVWEILQVPAYAEMPSAPHWDAIRTCTVATLGDVVLMLVSYAVVAAAARETGWLRRLTVPRVAGLLVAGLVISVVLELVNTRVLDRWQYAPGVPALAGMGINVWLQWLLLPPLTLWLSRRHLGIGISHPSLYTAHSPQGPAVRRSDTEITP